ncbi:MAG: Protein translocase membrane subunit SecG [Burkholderiaceae bacterium]|jgi:preprotein translocase subunit SecG|nr:MAG: Protein translocase membrane subunit SecG [Burkholderiaceae bacterium]
MHLMLNILSAVQILSAVGLVGLVLLQHGKGADMGAAFGGGASGSLFGASGSANFLSRTTAVLATVFFACTLALAYFGNLRSSAPSSGSVLERAAVTAPASAASSATTQIPGESSVAPPPAKASAAPAPAPAASGAAQIPTK